MRRRARTIYRMAVLATMAGLMGSVAAAAAAVPAWSANFPSAGELLEACRRSLSPQLRAGSLASIVFAGVAVTVVGLGGGGVLAELRRGRSTRSLVAVREPRVCAGYQVAVLPTFELLAFVAGFASPQICVRGRAERAQRSRPRRRVGSRGVSPPTP